MTAEIFNPKQSRGSGRGTSYYETAALCPRRAQLNEQQPESDSGPSAERGVVTHKLVELYHKGEALPELILSYTDAAGEPTREGMRLFAGYRQRYTMSEFGKVLGCEVLLPPGGLEATSEDTAKMLECFGVPYTCRLDSVVEPDDAALASLSNKLNMPLEKGVYIFDLKTKDRKDTNLHISMRFRPQFVGNQLLWNLFNPEKPSKGMIANVIVAHRKLIDESFCLIYVPPPSEEETLVFKTWLQNAAVLARTNMANLARCHIFGTCPHLLSGACTRR